MAGFNSFHIARVNTARCWLIAIALLAMHTAGLAQDTTERPLDEIIVTATRIQTTARDAARSMYNLPR
jgi:hypothetical protein